MLISLPFALPIVYVCEDGEGPVTCQRCRDTAIRVHYWSQARQQYVCKKCAEKEETVNYEH